MNALRTKLIAYRLDYHWIFLRKYRKKMLTLYEQGVGLSDKKMLALNEKFNHHCIKAMKLDDLFAAATTPKNI